jgi:hypothetical protein
MIISHELKFIFIHIQRTGGNTVINLLKHQLKEKVEIISQHGNAKTAELSLLEDYKDYFNFTFIRNPWDRILSWYLLIYQHENNNMDKERSQFEKFIELDLAAAKGDKDFHYNQLDYISNEKGNILINKCYRFDNFEEEVSAMLKDLGLLQMAIPRLNLSLMTNYRDYYTVKSRELINQKCKRDIAYFGFEF